MSSASGTGRNILFDALNDDTERNNTSRKGLGFVAFKSSNQSIPDATLTTIATYDAIPITRPVSASHNITTGIFTAPVEGFYSFIGQITFSANGTGIRRAVIVNLGTTEEYGSHKVSTPAAAQTEQIMVCAQATLAAGETVGLQCFQSSTAAMNVTAKFNGLYHGRSGRSATRSGDSL